MSNLKWPMRLLGDPSVASITSGGTPSRVRPEYFGGPVSWVKSGDLTDSRIATTEESISQLGLENSAARLLPPNTVLIALYGATVGKTGLLSISAATNQAICAIRPSAATFNPQFLQFMLMHLRPQLLSERSGGAQPNISQTIIRNLKLRCPDLTEQEKIAAVLWKVQRAIEVEERLVAAARELKQSALRQLFTHGLRKKPQKETPYGEVPESWEIKALSEWAFVQSGATKGRVIRPEDAIDVPYLRVANVQDGHLDLTEMKTIRIRRDELDGYRLQKDDVVLTEGGDFDKLGRGFIWEGQIDPCIHQNHIFAVRVNRERLWPRYFAYLAQSPYGKAYFLTVAHKTTNLACINTTKLRAFPVLRPELDEQKEIATILRTIDRKISLHERKRTTLSDLFQTLLHQLMTAQIRVDKLDIDTSEVAALTPETKGNP